jgi:hypothetical protein
LYPPLAARLAEALAQTNPDVLILALPVSAASPFNAGTHQNLFSEIGGVLRAPPVAVTEVLVGGVQPPV